MQLLITFYQPTNKHLSLTCAGVLLGVRGPVEGVLAGVEGALPSVVALFALEEALRREEVLEPPDTEEISTHLVHC